MFATAMNPVELRQRLDAAACHSPSSIAEVDYSTKRRKLSCANSPAAASQHRPSPPSPLQGDAFVSGRGVRAGAAPLAEDCGGVAKDINVALGTSSSSAPTRKRRLSRDDDGDALQFEILSTEFSSENELAEPLPTPLESETTTTCEAATSCPPEPLGEGAEAAADGACADAGAGVQCSPVASRPSRRTLYIEYWSRTDECKERKWDHLDAIADKYGAPEDHIFDTTLRGRTACLEPNMFPYATPAGIEHWTLWHEQELHHEQIKQYVENWIDANAPHVESWNYDDNPERSIDIFHVHVYLQVPANTSVLQGRAFDDLVHEMD